MKKTMIKVGFYVLSTPIGTLFFALTKKFFAKDKTSTFGNIWWYGYLYNYACRYNLNKIKNSDMEKRAVRVIMPDYDFFFFYNTVFHLDCVSHILYELSQGYIPVIDDHHHVWSMFFKQPIDVARNDDISQIQESDEYSTLHTPMMIPYCKPVRKVWSKLLRDFCHLNKETKLYIKNEIQTILADYRVLGVVCRGTDYIGTGAALQPEVDEVIQEAEVWMNKYGYEKIYLATEDERIYNRFITAFPDRILVNKRSYYDKAMKEQNVKWIGQVHFNREDDNYWKGLEYLSSIYILSRCNALLGGFCGASNVALLLNNERYERFKVYDLS